MNIRVIDNCLDTSSFDMISQTLIDANFPWYFCDSKVGPHYDGPGLHDQQFVHIFYENFEPRSSYISILDSLLDIINPMALVRIKANLTTATSEIIEFPMHTDLFDNSNNCMTAVYYVNSNNGYTLFESGERVDSVANRLVIFNSSIRHTGTTSTDTKNRCVININYYCAS